MTKNNIIVFLVKLKFFIYFEILCESLEMF